MLDHPLKPDGVLLGLVVAARARREPLVRPPPGGWIGEGSDVVGDLRRPTLKGDGPEHGREAAIDRIAD